MKKLELTFTVIKVPLDAAAIILAGLTAYWIRVSPFVTARLPVRFGLDSTDIFRVTIVVALFWVIVFALNRLYTTQRLSLREEVARVFYGVSTGMMLVFTVVFFRREIFDSRFIVLAAWVLAIFFIAISRALLRLLKRYLVSKGFGQHRVVLIGTKDSHRALVQEFNAKPGLGFHVIGSRPHINAETESWIVREHRRIGVDEIILTDANVRREDALKIMAFCEQNHISLMYTTDILGVSTLRLASHTFAGIPLLEVRRTPLDGWGKIYKRMFDIASALFLIVMTLPLQAVVTLLLALEQQGSVLFSRLPNGRPVTRIGENGKPFHFVKFRSMVKDAHVLRFDKDFIAANGNERGNSPLFKLKNDPRVTRIGRVLRRTSIDEIPQFYLVLAGKMSLIGPRPHLPEEVAEYKPEWRKVLNIKPGVTGMAQISGRADLDFEDEVRLDTFYIENWSPLLDLQILLKTPLAVFKAKGAK